jgi:hypothetical protein
LWVAENHLPPAEPTPIVRAWPADALVEDEWREFIDGSSVPSAFYLAAKLPTWIGLLALTGSITVTLSGVRGASGVEAQP